MLIDMDDNAEAIFSDIKKLPVVLCHKDFWTENIFYSDSDSDVNGKIILIDWDCAGWGYMGEDIASLIADDIDYTRLNEYYSRFIPAYYRGISEHTDVSQIENPRVKEMILIKFGYRFVHRHMFAETDDVKRININALQKIYEL